MYHGDIVHALEGGDRRSMGRVNQVVAHVRGTPTRFSTLIDCMNHEDEFVRMRAADAAEKLTVANSQWLQPFRRQLIGLAAQAEQKELRWHLAQMLPRLDLSGQDRQMAVTILRRYLGDHRCIVRTCAMQGLADFAQQDTRLTKSIRPILSRLIRTESASIKSRGCKLLAQLGA
ncbi:MAG TPA: hypothetical protein PKD12_18645 [Nitrospira sp.]|nr:hypothetical protein [Nitrospira sp.]